MDLKNITLIEGSQTKRIFIVWVYLYEFLEQEKLIGSNGKADQCLPGSGVGYEGTSGDDKIVLYFDWSNGYVVNKSIKTHLTLHLKWILYYV